VEFEHHVAIDAKRRDPVSKLDSGAAEQPRQSMGALPELAVREMTLAIADRRSMG
jgi:hypothetical protein